jgi:hypothetical protein
VHLLLEAHSSASVEELKQQHGTVEAATRPALLLQGPTPALLSRCMFLVIFFIELLFVSCDVLVHILG